MSDRLTACPQSNGTTTASATAGPATMATVTSFWAAMDDRRRLGVRAGGVGGSQRPGRVEQGLHGTSGRAGALEAEPYRTVSADRALIHSTRHRPEHTSPSGGEGVVAVPLTDVPVDATIRRDRRSIGVTMGRLDGHRAVITGAASGIGEATARLFITEGAAVVLADVDDDRGERIAEECGEQGPLRPHRRLPGGRRRGGGRLRRGHSSAVWTACSTMPATPARWAGSRRSTWPCSTARWPSICGACSSGSGPPPG